VSQRRHRRPRRRRRRRHNLHRRRRRRRRRHLLRCLVTLVDADPDRDEDALRDQEERRADAERERVHSFRLVGHAAAVVARDVVPVGGGLRTRALVAELELVADPNGTGDHHVLVVLQRL